MEGAKLQNKDADVLQRLREITDALREPSNRSSAETQERDERLTAALLETNRLLAERTQSRTSEFETERRERDLHDLRARDDSERRAVLDIMHQEKAHDAQTLAFQKASDDYLLVLRAMEVASGGERIDPRSLRSWKSLQLIPMVKAAIAQSDVGNAGDGWYPVAFSADMHEKVRLARRIAALHERVSMPTNPFKMPIEGADATIYTVAEATSSESYVTANQMILPTNPASLTNLTLTAKKMGARLVVDAEADEASIIALLPYFRRKLVRGMSDAEEDVTINGDLNAGTGTAIDFDMTPAANLTHQRANWSGYRKLAASAAKVALADANGLTITVNDLRELRLTKMGKYGINPADVVYVTGIGGYRRLMGLNAGGNDVLLTPDKFNQNATILTGQLATVEGIPVIVSEFVRENLNPTGVHDGVTTDRTILLCINREQFIFGDFRAMRLNSRYEPDSDQNVMVVLNRQTFGSWYPNDNTVGILYGIKK